jgi:hypothetical protein
MLIIWASGAVPGVSVASPLVLVQIPIELTRSILLPFVPLAPPPAPGPPTYPGLPMTMFHQAGTLSRLITPVPSTQGETNARHTTRR